ncbi:hypothetical protein NSU_2268 [Novosphingobium pentaromativorans US6-1]|uniref:Cupin 2 conserved barrel domain-containing protein n=2 Tax=Novosphingobium pentaromativorans TaxID=205844 RepID=G6ED47_9SPHN|nr:hypothetical protein NSU_2268 [Novosphingobium pentaromativorans US6-1]
MATNTVDRAGDAHGGNGEAQAGKFEIFRFQDAVDSRDNPSSLLIEPLPERLLPLQNQVKESGLNDAAEIKYLVKLPGFSVTHVWFKHDYPLPLHSHNADCLYYIVAGTIRLGSQTLGPRDSFFVPCDVPYQFRPGAEGVELLEIRHVTEVNLRHFSKSETFWQKALETVLANRDSWRDAKKPPLNC